MTSFSFGDSRVDNIKMIIFDKDGTLIDVHHYWRSMIQFRSEFLIVLIDSAYKEKVYSELMNIMGVDPLTNKIKIDGPVGIKPRDFIVNKALSVMKQYSNSCDKLSVEKIFNDVDIYSKTKLKNIVKILPCVKNFLADLKRKNVKMSIATTDLTMRAVLSMESLKINDYFSDIVGSDLVKSPKPSSDLVEYILNKNNIKHDEALVIGDSISDLYMAKNADCRFIGVKTGLYDNNFEDNSEYLISNLGELKFS
jgi:phosphoglycolate phosphatase